MHNSLKPTTIRAHLVSVGIPTPTFTVHHYLETRPARDERGNLIENTVEHVFKCFNTGAQRRWGLDRVEHLVN